MNRETRAIELLDGERERDEVIVFGALVLVTHTHNQNNKKKRNNGPVVAVMLLFPPKKKRKKK